LTAKYSFNFINIGPGTNEAVSETIFSEYCQNSAIYGKILGNPVSGGWSLVSRHWLLVAGPWGLVSGRWLLAAGYWFLVTGCR